MPVEALDPAAAAAKLQAEGAGEVVMSLGGAGLCIAAEGEPFMLQSFKADLVDITGAGDALAAAYLDARLRGLDVHTAGRRALAAAALTVACVESVCPALTPAALDAMVAT
jgi:pseudouridine kinase